MIELFSLAHERATALLQTGVPVYVPVNPVEYHGPHLSLHNDLLVSRGLARDLHHRVWGESPSAPWVMTSDLAMGVAPTPGPGTRAHSYTEVKETVLRASRALHALGARTVIFMTFHGDPMHNAAIECGVEALREMGICALNPFNSLLHAMLAYDPREHEAAVAHITDQELRERVLRDLPTDFHAGFFETSLALHYAPESVSSAYVNVPPCPTITPHAGWLAASRAMMMTGRTKQAAELRFVSVGLGWREIKPFPGYTGHPHLATTQSGAHFAHAILERYVAETKRCLNGEVALGPILRWTVGASLGGRLAV